MGTKANIGVETPNTGSYNITAVTPTDKDKALKPGDTNKAEKALVGQEVLNVQESLQSTVLHGAQTLDSAKSKGETVKETTTIHPLPVALSEKRVTETTTKQHTTIPDIDTKKASIGATLRPLPVALSSESKVTGSLIAKGPKPDTEKFSETVGISLEHHIPHAQDTSGITVESTQEVIETMMPELCAKPFLLLTFPELNFTNSFLLHFSRLSVRLKIYS